MGGCNSTGPEPEFDFGTAPAPRPTRNRETAPPPQSRQTANASEEKEESPARPRHFDSEYTRGRKIGAGAFAIVFLGTSRKTGTEFAVKDIDRSKMTWNGRDALQDEIAILQQLQAAPAIVHLEDVFPEARSCYLVMELMSGGQLFDRIIEKALFTEKEAKGSCRAILSALEFMHDRRMVHRDLKPENLLLKDKSDLSNVKLSDFGFSKVIEKKDGLRTLCGSPGYLAPEVLERYPAYDVACDTFSFGAILFLLLGGYMPFDANGSGDHNVIFENTRNGSYHFYPQRWKNISVLAKDLVAKCLTVNPHKRISIKDALNHDWFEADEKQNLAAPIQTASLADTVHHLQDEKVERRKRRRTTLHKDKLDRLDEMNELKDEFDHFLDLEKEDSMVTNTTGTSKSKRTSKALVYTTFEEDSKSGLPFDNFYERGDELGKGAFAVVYRSTKKSTGDQFAVKEIDTSRLDKHQKATLMEEITALKYLRGAPHIIRLYDVFKQPGKTILVLEEMKGGDLLERIQTEEAYTELEARELCKIAFSALSYCHHKGIAHRDIKLDNLLLVEKDCDKTVKLADFGFAKKCKMNNCLHTMLGTPNYMAPEIFRGVAYDKRCDNWSMGVVVFAVLGGYYPFDGEGFEGVKELVLRGKFDFHEAYWSEVSEKAKDLIRNLFKLDVDERYTAEDALASPWMNAEDAELHTHDLSVAQEKIKTIGAKKKFKGAVKAVMAASRMKKLGLLMKDAAGYSTKDDKIESIQEEQEQEEDEDEEEDEECEMLGFEDRYDLGMKSGDGMFGPIYLGTEKNTSTTYVVKKIVRYKLHPEDAASLDHEISVLEALKDCKYVVPLHEIYEDPDCTYIVIEDYKGNSLINKLIEKTRFNEFDAKELVRNLLLGVDYCHKRRIANRYLKLENLLLPPDNDTDIRISDFEYAEIVLYPNSLHTQCGTQEYVAPEILEHSPAYDVQCDMWAVGVILFVMLGGYYPFRGDSEEEILRKVRYGEFKFHKKYWKDVSEDAMSLVSKMLTVDPEERITAEDALKSDWFGLRQSQLSADLSKNMEQLKVEWKTKVKGVVKGIVAADRLVTRKSVSRRSVY